VALTAVPLPDGFADSLTGLFGERVSFTLAMREQHGASESHYLTSLPDAVVFPLSTEEVVALVKLCVANDVPIVAFGAGTCMEGQTTPLAAGVCVNMSRMDAIVTVNAADFDCTVQAGVRRKALNENLRDMGLFFPIDPGADATVGGMASTRASGTNAVRYGTMREAVLSLRVVTPDGREIRTARRARKSSAGYDLTRLMVGAEGTLGIITEVTLRLHPMPESIQAATCPFDTLEGAVDTVVQAIQLGIPLARVELLDEVQVRAVNQRSGLNEAEKPTLFFEFHGSERYVEEQVEMVGAIAQENGAGTFRWARQVEDRNRLWHARHDAFYAAVGLRTGCVGWTTDVCVPISRLAECILETKRELAQSSLPAPIVGHVGDGNFHVIFVIDPTRPEEMAEAERLNHRLVRRALDMDGSCTGEHGVGIGIGKQDWLREELGEGIVLMRAIKQAIDPKGLFNPGKIFTMGD
jgi:D-lactate dehydrogenase (cytochrome)